MTTVLPEQTSAPGSATSESVPRLRPALVNGQRIWVECPIWCVEDHVAASERHLEDVCHTSGAADLVAPREGGPSQLLLLSRLIAGTGSAPEDRQPLVTIDVDDVNGMYLEPAAADVFADGLVAFAEQVRALARTARDA
ncbi:DUF6907 domain-containing protein [Streptomyces sp. NPDC047990]|uniref:DUF6907 domain-containing protein n=1 Tax=Streptomyces sp. NPDC047990 TaxID=3365496 RepID=UPI00371BACA7